MTDDLTGLYVCSSTSTLEVAVRPKRDMDAEEPIDNETMRGAVRPKSDISQLRSRTSMTQSARSVTVKRKLSVQKTNKKGKHGAAAAKKDLKIMMMFQM